MRQIRRGVFESNSSSVHSITMCMKEDYDKWKNGEVYLNEFFWDSKSIYSKKQFVTKEEAIDIFTKSRLNPEEYLLELDAEELEKIFRSEEIYSYDNYNAGDFESFWDTFTTPNGDTVVSFGYYGEDR